MLVNSPSNPTGQVFSLATIHTITKFCKDKSITLISDEIYSDLAFDQKAVAQSPYRKYIESQSKEDTLLETAPVIMTGGLSKVCHHNILHYPNTGPELTNLDIFCWRLENRICHLPSFNEWYRSPPHNSSIYFRVLVSSFSASPVCVNQSFLHIRRHGPIP